ncbi:MAG: hypothetical protein ATN33_05675 [Epulopiscium sp. Nele67-Bin001]|nr:MAG: hypothetical protein ATN33_05675 [Epulopiscium sp. Nele67-Bin001]
MKQFSKLILAFGLISTAVYGNENVCVSGNVYVYENVDENVDENYATTVMSKVTMLDTFHISETSDSNVLATMLEICELAMQNETTAPEQTLVEANNYYFVDDNNNIVANYKVFYEPYETPDGVLRINWVLSDTNKWYSFSQEQSQQLWDIWSQTETTSRSYNSTFAVTGKYLDIFFPDRKEEILEYQANYVPDRTIGYLDVTEDNVLMFDEVKWVTLREYDLIDELELDILVDMPSGYFVYNEVVEWVEVDIPQDTEIYFDGMDNTSDDKSKLFQYIREQETLPLFILLHPEGEIISVGEQILY